MQFRPRPRIDLNVPYEEKDRVKSLKDENIIVLWEPESKKWFIPEGKLSEPFLKWLPCPIGSIRSDYFYLAETTVTCWNCDIETLVHGIMLPKDHEVFVQKEDKYIEGWKKQSQIALLNYLTWIHPNTNRFIQQHILPASYVISDTYLVNHCEHCDKKQEDLYLFCEPGEVFLPKTPEQAKLIKVKRMDYEFIGYSSSEGYEVSHFEHFKLKNNEGGFS